MNSDVAPLSPEPPPILNNEDLEAGRSDRASSSLPRHDNTDRSRRPRRRGRRKRAKADPGLVKKLEFVNHLLKNLDMFVFIEIAALYYMECSTLRFFIRAWTQHNFLSPKPDDWPIPMPTIRAQVLSVFLPTTICILAHLLESLPTAAETSRGYLHGGAIVDFIGQKPPSSRLVYLAFDIIIVGIQCLMLSVHAERERLRLIVRPKRSRLLTALARAAGLEGGEIPSVPPPTQTHNPGNDPGNLDNSEQRTTDVPGWSMDAGSDIELQPLATDNPGGGSDDSYPDQANPPPPMRTSLLDVMSSGNGMLRDFYVAHTLRNATPDAWGALGHTLQSTGYQATMARLRARVPMPRSRQGQG